MLARLERELRRDAPGLTDAQWQAVQVVAEDLAAGRWSTESDSDAAARIVDEAIRRFPQHWPPGHGASG